ncbi:MAG: hypothetical protein KGI71_05815 [Patescibacteria group bacterium]|nr:hypothetical protein [Patescibacteria group bacterium]
MKTHHRDGLETKGLAENGNVEMLPRRATSGDACPKCKGVLQVVNTRVIGATRRRYIGCRGCGFRPDQPPQTLPLAEAPRQQPKRWQTARTRHT